MGDFASIYLAALYGIDPTPVDAISELKQALALSDRPEPTEDDDGSDDDAAVAGPVRWRQPLRTALGSTAVARASRSVAIGVGSEGVG